MPPGIRLRRSACHHFATLRSPSLLPLICLLAQPGGIHHFVRHLLNRWGLAYYFCSVPMDRDSAIYYCCYAVCCCLRVPLSRPQKPCDRFTLPSAAPQTVWRSSGALKLSAISNVYSIFRLRSGYKCETTAPAETIV